MPWTYGSVWEAGGRFRAHHRALVCDRLVVGHLSPDGMLACLLAEADPQKEMMRL